MFSGQIAQNKLLIERVPLSVLCFGRGYQSCHDRYRGGWHPFCQDFTKSYHKNLTLKIILPLFHDIDVLI